MSIPFHTEHCYAFDSLYSIGYVMDGGFRSVKNAYTSNSSYSEFAVLDGIGRNLYLIYWRNWVISIPDTRGTGFYSLLRNAIQEVLVNIQY